MHTRVWMIVVAVAIAEVGCATKAMRAQADALASAGERLEAETAAFTEARTAVVQLRQRNLVQRRQEVAEQGQYNVRTVAGWKIASDPERARKLELFHGVVAASEAMYEVRDQGPLWEESVIAARSALAIDRAALHRFVRQLITLSRPMRVIEGARFYLEYGIQVAAQVDADLAAVKALVADPAPVTPPGGGTPTGPTGLGPGGPTGPTDPTGPSNPNSSDPTRPLQGPPTDPRDPRDPRDPSGDPTPRASSGPDNLGANDRRVQPDP